MAYVRCTVCRHDYRAEAAQSTCPACGRVNVRVGILDGVPRWAIALVAVFVAFLLLVAVATYINS